MESPLCFAFSALARFVRKYFLKINISVNSELIKKPSLTINNLLNTSSELASAE